MTNATRRGRVRAATDQDIRRTARALLVEQGPEAVTLRAIARELGITAPALYRYYGSREDLVEHLRHDVCADLADELSADIAHLSGDAVRQLFAICRGFRGWALTHPSEFTLVFASGSGAGNLAALRHPVDEPFGRIFLTAAARVLARHELAAPPEDAVPEQLRGDLANFRSGLLVALAESDVRLPPERLDLGTTYMIIQFWARLYGHVTLEVFGNYPVRVTEPGLLFDTLLAHLAKEVGLYPG